MRADRGVMSRRRASRRAPRIYRFASLSHSAAARVPLNFISDRTPEQIFEDARRRWESGAL